MCPLAQRLLEEIGFGSAPEPGGYPSFVWADPEDQEVADGAWGIAEDSPINILGDMELHSVVALAKYDGHEEEFGAGDVVGALFASFRDGGSVMSFDIVVDAAYQRYGLGKRLFAAAMDDARASGVDMVQLHAVSDGGAALARSAGFTDAGGGVWELRLEESGMRARLGRCYELSGREAMWSGGTLVHGSIEGFGNPRIKHAWVEREDGTIYDPVMDQEFPPDVWQAFASPEEDRRYTFAEVARKGVETGHWGPWDDLGESRAEPKPDDLKDTMSDVSLGEDGDGWYVFTHRGRSDSYPDPHDIPAADIEWVASTG